MTAVMPLLTRYRPQLKQCIRVTAAALAAYGVNLALDFQQGYWMAFTAILVVQGSVGGSVRAAFERMTGTLSGAAYGALVSTLLPHDTHPMFALTVIVGLAPAAFAAALSPVFRIAPITVAILLFSNTAQQLTPIVFAEHRVAEIGLGCIIGLAMSLLVVPSRAHALLAEAAGKVLMQYADLLSIQLAMASKQTDYAVVDAHHAGIRRASAQLDVMAEEARRERKSRLTTEPDPEPLLRMIRRVRNDLVMIGRSLTEPLPEAARPVLLSPFSDIVKSCTALFAALSTALPGRDPVAIPPGLDAAFDAFAAAMNLAKLPEADMGRLFTLGFALEQLRQNLSDLAARANEFIAGDAPAP